MIRVFVVFIFSMLLLFEISNATSLNNYISPNQYASNSTIHYIPNQLPNNEQSFNETFNFSNDAYNYKTILYYYGSPIYYKNSSSSVVYNIPQKASLPFVKRLSNYCKNIYTNESSYLLFNYLCNANNSSLFFTTGINNQSISELANFVSLDNFTKQLYDIYYQYSSICLSKSAGNNYADFCNGNLSIPNPESYFKFYSEIATLYKSQLTANETYKMLSLENNNFSNIQNQRLFHSNIQIDEVFPSLLPSDMNYNNSEIIIPTFINFSKNVGNIKNDYNKSISLFLTYNNYLSKYSYYNVQTNNNVFNSTFSSGFQTYSDSCNTHNAGLSSVESSEEAQNYKNELSQLEAYDISPRNFINSAEPYSSSLYYSIIKAIPSNVSIDSVLIYGVKLRNGNIVWENQTNIQINSSTNLIELKIPQSAFSYSNYTQIFAEIKTTGNYQMSFYYFNEIEKPSTYSFNHYTYQEQKIKTVKEVVNNVTITKQIPYFVNCYVQQVETNTSFEPEVEFLGNKQFNINNIRESYINTSTYLPKFNVFKTIDNQTQLNYSYIYSNLNTSPNPLTYTKITIPIQTAFSLYTNNNTFLYSFNTFTFDSNLITNKNESYLVSESKNLYSYNPSIVYPNLQTGMVEYIPTIVKTFTNSQYIIGTKDIIYNDLNTYDFGFLNFLNNFFSNLINGNIKADLNYGIISEEGNAYSIYKNSCLSGSLEFKNICVIPSSYYTIGEQNSTSSKDYDLLNPTIYTQNNYLYGYSTPAKLYSDLEYEKGNLFSGFFSSIFGEQIKNLNITNLYINTNQLDFNLTWKNWTTYEKQEFYNSLENISTRNDVYSYMIGNSTSNINTELIKNVTINPNNTITIILKRPYTSLHFSGEDYNYFYDEYLSPTNSSIVINYGYIRNNDTSYLFYLPEYLVENKTFNPQAQITIYAGNKSESFNVQKAFFINHKYSLSTSFSQNKTSITVYSPQNNINVSINKSFYNYKNMKYEINNTSYSLKFSKNYYLIMFLIAIAYIFLYLFYREGFFDELIDKIKQFLNNFP